MLFECVPPKILRIYLSQSCQICTFSPEDCMYRFCAFTMDVPLIASKVTMSHHLTVFLSTLKAATHLVRYICTLFVAAVEYDCRWFDGSPPLPLHWSCLNHASQKRIKHSTCLSSSPQLFLYNFLFQKSLLFSFQCSKVHPNVQLFTFCLKVLTKWVLFSRR
jgi:hypothetical protein